MKKMFRKAFTLVELLVVIAILAALATVGIISFSAYTKKANQASDNTLLTQLNHSLMLMEEEPETYTEMKEYLSENTGYDIDRISTFSKNCKYAWNSEENKLCLVDDSNNIIQPSSDAKAIPNNEKHLYYVPVQKYSEIDVNGTYNGFSCYLKDNFDTQSTITVNAGVDTGNNAIGVINYVNNGNTKNVVIRTSSASTTLNVNAPLDHINHYGAAGIVNLQQVANTSYFEYGSVAFVELTIGRIVLTEESDVEVINVAKKDANTYNNPIIADGGVKEENMPEIISRDQVNVTDASGKTPLVQVQKTDAKGNIQGTVEQVYAYASEAVGTTEKTNIQNSTIDSTLGLIVLDSNAHAGEKAYSDTQKDTKKDEVANEAVSSSLASETNNGGSQKYVARIGSKGYETFESAVNDAQNKSVRIILLANIDLTKYSQVSQSIAGYDCHLEDDTLDLNGFTITNNNHGVDYYVKGSKIMNGSFVAANGGSYAMCVTGGSSYLSTIENVNCTGGINCWNTKVRIKGGEISSTKGTNYYAVWADNSATVYVEGGNYTSPSTLGGCVLRTVANEDTSKIIILGGEFSANGTTQMFSANSNIRIVGGTFNKDPQSNISTNCSSIYDSAKCVWNVKPTQEGKTVLVYADAYNLVECVANESDLNEEGKLISGEYVVYNDSAIKEFVANGYTAIGSWSGYIILKTEGSNSSYGAVASISYNSKTIYYTSFETCLKEAKELGVTTITLRSNQTIDGNLDGSMSFNGTSYTLTVNGTITGGTYGCKISAQAITGGTFNSSTAVNVPDGSVTGGEFKAALAQGKVATGKYVKFENNMFVVTNDISTCEAYYVLNNYNVYGAYSVVYSKGNLTLIKDVTATTVAVGKTITLNGHILTVNLAPTAVNTVITNKANTAVYIVKKEYVNNDELVAGYHVSSVKVTEYPIASGYKAVAYSTYDYIVKSADLDANDKVYKGAYNYNVYSIVAEGYSSTNAVIEGTTYYVVGKNTKTFNNLIVGGVFDFNPTAYVDTNNASIVENAGIWTVTIDETKCVAQVGENKYLSLSDAYSAVAVGGEIKLLKDLNYSGSEDIYLAKTCTINLNEHTITSTASCALFRPYNYSGVSANTIITIKNGSISTTDKLVNSRGTTIIFDDVNVTCGSIGSIGGSGTSKGILKIVSGTFNKDVTNYVANGSTISESNGVWTVALAD